MGVLEAGDIPERADAGSAEVAAVGLSPTFPADDLVARCLDDLLDDFQRTGGKLSYNDVTRMTTKRDLTGHQLAALLEGLVQSGVTPSGLVRGRGSEVGETLLDCAERRLSRVPLNFGGGPVGHQAALTV